MAKRNKYIALFLLLPISKIYGFVVAVRNKLFDWKFFKQETFDIPLVSVGNLAVGGTGKTPHVEYIVNAFRARYNIAILSRGYKRHTKGFVLATMKSAPTDIGDEPYQMFHKFGGNVKVAVCEKRKEGIERLREIDPTINLIVLDDAFQHRYVKPKVSILLTEYNRPIYDDYMLPLGRLRESASAVSRAEMVIVTKCPAEMAPLKFRLFKKGLNLYPYQQLYFSEYAYEPIQPVFPENVSGMPNLQELTSGDSLMALCGIANPRTFNRYVKSYGTKVKSLHFPDHHVYTREDFDLIEERFAKLAGRKYIITSEKDAVRLASSPYFPHKLKPFIFYVPITVKFKDYETGDFDNNLEKLIKEVPL